MAARETIVRAFPCDARYRVAVASIQRLVQRTLAIAVFLLFGINGWTIGYLVNQIQEQKRS